MLKNNKGENFYKVIVTRLQCGGNHEDIKKIVFQGYRWGKSKRQVISRLKHEYGFKGYDNYYGSESIDFIFDVIRDVYLRTPKKVSQIDLFDNNKDLFEYEKKGK